MKDKIEEIYKKYSAKSNCQECGDHGLDLFYEKVIDIFSDIKTDIEGRIKHLSSIHTGLEKCRASVNAAYYAQKLEIEFLQSLLTKLNKPT